jgi:hypothetical protein
MGKNKKDKLKLEITKTNLRNILAQQLTEKNLDVSEGVFEDQSASWILVKGDIKVSDEEIFRLDIELGFNADGDEITGINVFKVPFKLTEEDVIKIFPV